MNVHFTIKPKRINFSLMDVYNESVKQLHENDKLNKKLPNATAVLVLGILSIVVVSGIGFILGIISFVLHQKDKEIYQSDKEKYKVSYDASKAGFICAIVGVSISALSILLLIYLMI